MAGCGTRNNFTGAGSAHDLNINSIERARFNSAVNNGFMRIGLNAGLLDAARRLEVFDALNTTRQISIASWRL